MDAPITARLDWIQDQAFEASVGEHRLTIDGETRRGLSPMQHLALAIAGCMGIDVAHILTRMRTPPDRLRVEVEAQRRDEEPRRFTRVTLDFVLTGDVSESNLERALELSRDKYCSAWATIGPDTELVVRTSISPQSPA